MFFSKPKTRNDHFEFIMEGINDNEERFTIGSKVFPLNTIESQDEYEVQIIIPEKNDDSKPAAHINCKIIFYWSDFQFYDEKRKKEEKKVNSLQKAVNKLRKYQNEIYEIYHLNDRPNLIGKNFELPNFTEEDDEYNIDNFNNNIKEDSNYQLRGQHKKNNQNNYYNQDYNNLNDNKNYAYGTNSSYLNNYTSTNTKYLCGGISLLGILSSFYRPDFPNELGGLLLLFGTFFINRIKDNQKVIQYLRNMFYSVIGLLFYDLVWIILNLGNSIHGTDQYTGGNENGVMRCSMLLAIANLVLKGLLSLNLNNQIRKLRANQPKPEQDFNY